MIKNKPLRTCVVSREKRQQDELVRIGFDKINGVVKVGIGSGRGVYLLPDIKILEEALKKGKISYGLRLGRALSEEERVRLKDEFGKYLEKILKV